MSEWGDWCRMREVVEMPKVRFEVVALLRNGCTQRTDYPNETKARAGFKEVKDKVLYKCILSYQSDDDMHPILWAETS